MDRAVVAVTVCMAKTSVIACVSSSGIIPTSFCISTIDRVVGLGLCLGAIFTAFRLDRPCRIPKKVRGRPGGPTLPRGRRTTSKSDGPLVLFCERPPWVTPGGVFTPWHG